MRKNGKIICCENCKKDVYKPLGELKRSKKHFCSAICANEFQSRNKVEFSCKICSSKFLKSAGDLVKSEKRNHKIQYCSIACRNSDAKRMTEKAQKMNEIQFNKVGLNKLEIAGREWLEALGFLHNVDFFEQVLLFDKFCVDVYFPKFNLVVQFDGNYWHSKPKRQKLDISQDAYLTKAGLRVFRITDIEMKTKDVNLFYSKLSQFIFTFNPNISQSKIIFK